MTVVAPKTTPKAITIKQDRGQTLVSVLALCSGGRGSPTKAAAP